jgi:hypothetical protein
MTDEEVATASAAPMAATKGMTDDEVAAAMAPAAPKKDVGPEARRARGTAGGMRPEPKPDDVSIEPDYTKHDARLAFQGRNDLITTPERRAASTARSQANDPIRNDPLAGMILQGLVAGGAGAAAGGATKAFAPGLSKLVGGATTGAVANPDDPLTGAALGAIPGIPAAAGAADRAIGQAALARTTAPVSKSFEAAGKMSGMSVGTVAGHHAVPFIGAPIGAAAGAKLGAVAGRAADSAVEALARRRLIQMAEAAPEPEAALLDALKSREALGGPAAESMARTSDAGSTLVLPRARLPAATGAGGARIPVRTPLAPLVHEGPVGIPESVNPFDELTGVGAAKGHATVGEGTAVLPRARRLSILDENGRDLLAADAAPSLRADVARDAKALRSAPVEEGGGDISAPFGAPGGGSPPDALGAQLADSVRILDELTAAKKAGLVTPAMARAARKAGLPSRIVARVSGLAPAQFE